MTVNARDEFNSLPPERQQRIRDIVEHTRRLEESEEYRRLIERFPLVDIESDEQLDFAMEIAQELGFRDYHDGLNSAENAYLDCLLDLMESYEDGPTPETGTEG